MDKLREYSYFGVLIFFIPFSAFLIITELNRSFTIFINLIFLPIGGYIGSFVYFNRLQEKDNDNMLFLVWITAIIARLVTLFFPVGLSDDVYRYIWDGQVQHTGINPYQYSPSSPELEFLRSDWFNLINNPTIHSPYPVFSQFIFWAVTLPELGINQTILLLRLLTMVFDLGVIWLLNRFLVHFQRNQSLLILYAWSPLIIFEFAGNAHIDIIAVFFMLLGLFLFICTPLNDLNTEIAVLSLVLSIHTKLFPIVIIPFILKKLNLRSIILGFSVFVILLLPYFDPKINPLFNMGLESFIRYFRFNESLFRVYAYLLDGTEYKFLPRLMYILMMVFILAVLTRNYYQQSSDMTMIRNITLIILLGLLLGPDVHPWYLSWVLPLAIITDIQSVIVFSVSVLLSYQIYPVFDQTGIWKESPIILLLEYLPVYTVLILETLMKIWRINFFEN